jgi:hypothetical protein
MDEATKTPSAPNEGYCVKCKAKRLMNAPVEVEMPGKGEVRRRAMTGTCSTCSTKMFKILGKKV